MNCCDHSRKSNSVKHCWTCHLSGRLPQKHFPAMCGHNRTYFVRVSIKFSNFITLWACMYFVCPGSDIWPVRVGFVAMRQVFLQAHHFSRVVIMALVLYNCIYFYHRRCIVLAIDNDVNKHSFPLCLYLSLCITLHFYHEYHNQLM